MNAIQNEIELTEQRLNRQMELHENAIRLAREANAHVEDLNKSVAQLTRRLQHLKGIEMRMQPRPINFYPELDAEFVQ